jgi:chorismate mutase
MKIQIEYANKLQKKKFQNNIFLVAGPCSVESENQICAIASALGKCNVTVLRGGIWKPRTRPGTFEGVGEIGLRWLKDAGKHAHLPVAVEVATPDHVEKSLRYGIDFLWVGARTTANPFAVQAIADALKGVDISVMVKNPISPDLDLWIGALERLNNAGITNLMAIHRGFSSYGKTEYRNVPNWRIPIELKRILPKLPMLCDPSHISGNTSLIPSVAQEALDLLFDGLMVEVHNRPEIAMSDGKQQLTPRQFRSLLNTLTLKRQNTDNRGLLRKIIHLRKEVDEVDYGIIHLLTQRMQITNSIGSLKKSDNLTSYQPNRWKKIIKSRLKLAKKESLNEDFVFALYQLIHEEAIKQQEKDVLSMRRED